MQAPFDGALRGWGNSLMSYKDQLNKHLVRYKKSHPELGSVARGTFTHRGIEREYDHILPRSEQWSNLIEPARAYARRYLATHPGVALHTYFRHLNSSQAFTFNLFLPFFCGESIGSSALLRALGQWGEVTNWEFETVPVPGEDTNVDVLWDSSIGPRTYCEVKLSEADFGTAANDEAHNDKLRSIYSKSLIGQVDAILLEPTTFFDHYQLLRNLWQIVGSQDARLIFLLPRANKRIWKDATLFKLRVAQSLRERVTVVAIEDVILGLCEDNRCPDSLKQHAQLLRAKYIF
jgi:hypothetical protein